MGVFDGSVYRIRARKGETFADPDYTESAATAGDVVESYKTHGWDAVEVREVHFVNSDVDPLHLSFGDYWGGEDEEED